jgi:asparagine synthase (glutamine-hydrolysing)
MRGFHTKYLFKKAMAQFLPREILLRRKHGFTVPVAAWFRNELKEYVREILLGDTARKRGYFNNAYIKEMLQLHCSGQQDLNIKLWTLLVLELWHRVYIDGNSCLA